MVLVLISRPFPQVLLHCDQLDQLEYSQSKSRGKKTGFPIVRMDDTLRIPQEMLQDSESEREPVSQGTPPFSSALTMVLVLVLVMRTGEATGKAVNMLRDIASYVELHRDKWLVAHKTHKSLFPFFTKGLRYRLDDLATASLTSFQDYLYYNDAVDEMAPLPFYQIPEAEAEDEDELLL